MRSIADSPLSRCDARGLLVLCFINSVTYLGPTRGGRASCAGRGEAVMPRRSPFVIRLSVQERAELEARCKVYTSPYRDVMRAKIVLLASEGLGNDQIAARLGTPRQIASKWRHRFWTDRLAG